MTHVVALALAARTAGANSTHADPVANALQNGAQAPATFVGIAVGIGIGCFVVGAVIGACAMKWRHRHLIATAPVNRYSTADLAAHPSGRQSMYGVQAPVVSAGAGFGQTVHAVPDHVYMPSSRVV